MLGPDPAKSLSKCKFTRRPINVAGLNHYPAALANSCAIEQKLLSVFVAVKNFPLPHNEPTDLDFRLAESCQKPCRIQAQRGLLPAPFSEEKYSFLT